MRKQFLRLSAYLFLGLSISTATLTSCSNDDSSVYNIAIKRADVNALTSSEVTIDPEIKLPTAIYTWYSPALGGVISNEEVLKYTFDEPGTYALSLKVEEKNRGIFDIYTYNVIVDKNVDYNYVTLNLSAFDLSNGDVTSGGKIWKDTFTEDAVLKSGIFEFKHIAYPDWYTWMGFTVSNSNDNADQMNSDAGWVGNQWGTMPKGGVDGVGTPFLVSFADHKPNESLLQPGTKIEVDRFSSVVTLGDDKEAYKAISTSVAISPWPYYGVLNGDSFARKFEKGDYFALHVYGVGKDQKLTSANPVTHYFVDFRNGVNTINTDWSKMDLSSLGEVKYLLFFLETTDVGQWGANTALYFTMDKLTVDKIAK